MSAVLQMPARLLGPARDELSLYQRVSRGRVASDGYGDFRGPQADVPGQRLLRFGPVFGQEGRVDRARSRQIAPDQCEVPLPDFPFPEEAGQRGRGPRVPGKDHGA